ncbi:hypothetical protein NPIL_617831 [Nephila pilipes]|uniref:Uncharacterized protein n=1 Tax=Nephila pilipes TaxID=299642 RepID=A0A8X6MA87_NEPPI|nr:hypothetical protein NPIL_617831 [Nephila pilipes]
MSSTSEVSVTITRAPCDGKEKPSKPASALGFILPSNQKPLSDTCSLLSATPHLEKCKVLLAASLLFLRKTVTNDRIRRPTAFVLPPPSQNLHFFYTSRKSHVKTRRHLLEKFIINYSYQERVSENDSMAEILAIDGLIKWEYTD